MAITTPLGVLTLIAPTYAVRSDVADYLGLSIRQHLDASSIGARYPELIAYHAAHRIAVVLLAQAASAAGSVQTAGPVTQLRTGDLGVSYGALTSRGGISPEDEEYLTTSYGRTYLSIRNSLHLAAPAVYSPDPGIGLAIGVSS